MEMKETKPQTVDAEDRERETMATQDRGRCKENMKMEMAARDRVRGKGKMVDTALRDKGADGVII